MDAAIRTRHQEVFSEWMNLTVEQQTAEVLRFLPVARDGIGFLRLLGQRKAFGLLLPPSASEDPGKEANELIEAVRSIDPDSDSEWYIRLWDLIPRIDWYLERGLKINAVFVTSRQFNELSDSPAPDG
jgi:hypothetical protein